MIKVLCSNTDCDKCVERLKQENEIYYSLLEGQEEVINLKNEIIANLQEETELLKDYLKQIHKIAGESLPADRIIFVDNMRIIYRLSKAGFVGNSKDENDEDYEADNA